MEKHKCKFCLRSFSNGRALGGHMRSHMMNLPKQTESSPPPPPRAAPTVQLSLEAESASSLSYGLRENPKRSFRFTDPNQIIDAGSIILQEDGESETESSKNNPTGPRSKRVKKDDPMKNSVHNETVSVSVLSSSSDITTEEDVAFFLISLSREDNNIWKTHTQHHDQQHQQHEEEQEDEQYEQQQDEDDEDAEEEDETEAEAESEEEEEEEELKPLKKVRGRYKCDTCNKVFRSYQALGGHRASHKKNKQLIESGADHSISQHHEKINIEKNINVNNTNSIAEKKIHQCPICFREFSSGQALGGHRRTHNIGFGSASASTSAAATTTMVRTNIEVARVSTNVGDSLLDLNFPAPMDEDEVEDDGDDDVSQVEGSAVSDAEFVKPH